MFCSLAFRKFSLMASKPHHIGRIAEKSLLSSAKKRRTMSKDSYMPEGFQKYADYLNELNDKRERVVKASRDITINSKRLYFRCTVDQIELQFLVSLLNTDGFCFLSTSGFARITKSNKEEVLEKAEKDLAAVTGQYMSRLVKELQGTDFWKLRRAYSPGVQEYVEAATFCKFCRTGTLLNLAEINATLLPLSDQPVEPLQINVLDYLLGLADLTGELMRLAIGRISDGELDYAERICNFVRDIYRELTLLVPYMDENLEMKKKMETMHQSMVKIENACFSVRVRGSEYTPLLGSDNPDYSILGVPDIEL